MMRRTGFFPKMLQVLQTVVAAAAVSCAFAQSAPVINLGYAQYQGTVSAANISHFLGIRYAAAPLGDLRFRAPQPPATVTGVQQATVQPNQCFQASNGLSLTNPLETRATDDVISTEDCLFLNVYYPSNASGTPVQNLPVLVWIHGGGYLAGQASAYNGEDIINQSNRGLVVVIIQYRLGVFGFLPGTEVKQNGALNAGLLDQDAALRWVHTHINKFGGDPSKVTIWGESAGAGSVLQHVVANDGKTVPQLFRAAITSSSFLPSQYQYNDRIPELLFSEVVAQVNCTSAADKLACLRTADANALQTANTQINNGGFWGTFLFVPVVDGTFITQRPTLSLSQGKVNGKNLLSVTNTFEGNDFVDQGTAATANATQYALDLFPDFGPVQADKVGALYAGLGTPLFQENAIQGESIFICPTYFLLNAFGARSFKAEFAIPPGLHAIDVAYYWSSQSTPGFDNTAFINAFAQSFTSFAISLDPNVKVSPTITPAWPRWAVGHTEMLFNETAGVPVVKPVETSDALLERCQKSHRAMSVRLYTNLKGFNNVQHDAQDGLLNLYISTLNKIEPVFEPGSWTMFLRLAFWATIVIAAPSINAQVSPVINLGYGQYQGTVNTSTNLTTFLGIPYAAAPIGDLRFRAPQPPLNVTGVQQATAEPNQCFQAGDGTSPTNPLESRDIVIGTSEDCLFLNLFFPSDATGVPVGSLPTIVWIHGGGYDSGAGSTYRGTDLINQSNRGVVVVSIQYRLGVFGFLSGEEVKKNGALNAGLLDQDFALRWVNKHISKFGGDPSKVTIWGQSAGAGSVLQHIVANNGQTKPQLFRGAITSSAFLPSQYNYNDRIPELLYSEVVARTNCSTATDSMACLRAADAIALETANANINADAFYGLWPLVPVIDGEFITQRLTVAFAEGKINGEALLSVGNAFEGTIFVDQSTGATANATQYALDVFPKFGPVQADTVGKLYAGLGTQLFQENAIQGESLLICPTYYALQAFAGRSFKGEFAIPPATHGNDVLYYFPSIALDYPELIGSFFSPIFNNTAFVDAFAQSFTSFAISLDPNVKVDPTTITPKWNTWDIGRTEMLFNKTDSGEPVVKAITTSDAFLERCQSVGFLLDLRCVLRLIFTAFRFWNSVGNLTGQ
ncbi:Alpha/Beta hydrolase protein [Mycena galericulata]|nr:Alpha/Beta hydrolase protein [Mycena galericulata]